MRCSQRQSRKASCLRAAVRAGSVWATSCFLVAGANAASEVKVPCKEATDVTLRVTFEELIAEIQDAAVIESIDASHVALENILSEIPLNPLAPRAEAAIRDAFDDEQRPPMIRISTSVDDDSLHAPIVESSNPPVAPHVDDGESSESDSGMQTRLPGTSDVDFSRYKKRMYRRDI